MASVQPELPSPRLRSRRVDAELVLQETRHRCANDLQMVVGLLSLQARRCENEEARQALAEAADRVAVLARARSALVMGQRVTLKGALQGLCEALRSQAEVRSINVSAEVPCDVDSLSTEEITTLALVVNELATNAIKHAFEEDVGGKVCIEARPPRDRELTIVVDDDGLPFPELTERGSGGSGGLGLGMVRQMMESMGGTVILPPSGSKRFEVRMPIAAE